MFSLFSQPSEVTESFSAFLKPLEATFLFTVLGLVFFVAAFWGIVKVCPFSIRKEIEDDQNVALAIIIASVILGIAMIISAALHG